MPLFSILIPTRDRPATFRHTLATVASQPGDDYEIVVADNCGGPETRQIVEELASSRIRYTRSEEILPMADNWEKGLSLCSGEYVTVLGDDDGFVPSTLTMARKLIDATSPEMICWRPHVYWWPDTIVDWNRNLLVVFLGNQALLVESRDVLERFYRGSVSLASLPMIYSGFYHRDIIDEARRRYGGFFVPREAAPDIASGILGLHVTQQYVYSTRPLSVRGNSGKSNGTAQWARSLGARQREAYFREERIGLQGMIHGALVPSPNLHIIVASAMLRCKDLYFPQDETLSLDLNGVLKGLVAALNFEPEAYEENLKDVQALAARLGVGLDAREIPEKELRERRLTWGPALSENEGESVLNVNGEFAGVRNIADAARLIEALLHPVVTYPGQ